MGVTKVQLLNERRCFVFHKWELILDTRLIKYFECEKCKSRKALAIDKDIYQPIDYDWVLGKKDSL